MMGNGLCKSWSFSVRGLKILFPIPGAESARRSLCLFHISLIGCSLEEHVSKFGVVLQALTS